MLTDSFDSKHVFVSANWRNEVNAPRAVRVLFNCRAKWYHTACFLPASPKILTHVCFDNRRGVSAHTENLVAVGKRAKLSGSLTLPVNCHIGTRSATELIHLRAQPNKSGSKDHYGPKKTSPGTKSKRAAVRFMAKARAPFRPSDTDVHYCWLGNRARATLWHSFLCAFWCSRCADKSLRWTDRMQIGDVAQHPPHVLGHEYGISIILLRTALALKQIKVLLPQRNKTGEPEKLCTLIIYSGCFVFVIWQYLLITSHLLAFLSFTFVTPGSESHRAGAETD